MGISETVVFLCNQKELPNSASSNLLEFLISQSAVALVASSVVWAASASGTRYQRTHDRLSLGDRITRYQKLAIRTTRRYVDMIYRYIYETGIIAYIGTISQFSNTSVPDRSKKLSSDCLTSLCRR